MVPFLNASLTVSLVNVVLLSEQLSVWHRPNPTGKTKSGTNLLRMNRRFLHADRDHTTKHPVCLCIQSEQNLELSTWWKSPFSTSQVIPYMSEDCKVITESV